jgi:hypothetical protein
MNIGVRTIDLFVQEILMNDIDRAQTYNKAVEYLNEMRQRADSLGLTGELDQILDEIEVKNPFNDKVAVELTIIRPEEELPAKNMNFNPEDMRKMIKLGHVMAKKVLSQALPDPDPIPVLDQ